MAKYSKEMVAQCEEWVREHGLMEFGGAMLKDFCREMHIDNKTYYKWMQVKDDFIEAIKRAKEEFKRNLTHDLSQSLASAARGGEYTKTKRHKEYRPNSDGTHGQLVKLVEDEEKGYNPPNVAAAIFLLTNLDPEHYQNRQRNDIAIKKDEERQMTIEEINAEIVRLEKLENE